MPAKKPTPSHKIPATGLTTSKVGKSAGVTKDYRTKTGRVPGAANISGRLGDVLATHAFERCRHFFLFITTIKAIEYVNNRDSSRTPISAANGFDPKATHQVDDGFRSEQAEHVDFRRDDDMIVEEFATSFTNTDAAHFCNLGIKPSFTSQLDLSNPVIFDLHEKLKTFAGNTMWLPQIVNIGPDRKIDVLHGELAAKYLKDLTSATCSRTRIADYITQATVRLTGYAQQQTKAKKHGKAACALCYVTAYSAQSTHMVGPFVRPDPTFSERVFSAISGEVVAWAYSTFTDRDERARVEQMLISYN